MSNKTIHLNLFGEPSLSWKEHRIDMTDNHGQQLWMILIYLILNRDHPVDSEELCGILNVDRHSSNPKNALKTSICRARSFLKELSPDFGRLIQFRIGSYQWDAGYKVVVDLEYFDSLLLQAEDTGLKPSDRLMLYMEALSVYGTGLPKRLEKSSWFHKLALCCSNNYITAARQALELLEELQNYTKIVELCTSLLIQEPSKEEFHYRLILALHKLGQNREARECYHRAVHLLYQKFSVIPGKAFHDLYLLLLDHEAGPMENIDTLTKWLTDDERNHGAYYCDFAVFKIIYQVAYRSGIRTGSFPHLCLLTVSPVITPSRSKVFLLRTMEKLADMIYETLRRNDIFTQVGPLQYAVLLSQTTYEGGCIAAERIVRQVRHSCSAKYMDVTYTLRPVCSAADDTHILQHEA